MRTNITTALDIGSSSIKVIIAQSAKDGKTEIKGLSHMPTEGIERGLVRDISMVSASIRKALEEAEKLADTKAQNIYCSISGEHVRTSVADGRISIPSVSANEPGEITTEHLEQVIEESRNLVKIQKANDRCRILHSFPQGFSIDGHEDIYNPINMNGFLLVATVCSVFAELTPLRNLSKCIELAGYHIEQDNFVLSHIATANSVLSDDERRLGCILIDMGGGTSDIAIFNRGILEKILVVPRAGAVITEDIAIGLKTPISFAESIKQEYGSANAANVDPSIEIEIEGISGRAPSRKTASLVSHVIQHRVEDILNLCYNKTKDFYTPELVTAGIVLTGGTANLRDIASVVEESFNLPVKIARPNLDQFFGLTTQLNDPAFATAVGLLNYGAAQDKDGKPGSVSLKSIQSIRIFDKLKQFLKDFT